MPDVNMEAFNTLCRAARDTSQHIGGLVDELTLLRHAETKVDEASHKLVERQVARIRDQLALLSSLVDRIEKLEHTPR
jgi:hypothetical protein